MSFSCPSKAVKEVVMEDDSHQLRGHRADERPSIEITKCISFQKFRYTGEDRPGKKYQEKEFVTLKLNNLTDKVVRVVIMCVDADNAELIHPNGLIGAYCKDGIYDRNYAVTKRVIEIHFPYIMIVRIKTKTHPVERITQIVDRRISHLPSPYRERCHSQCSRWVESSFLTFNTAKVRLGVIVTLENDTGNLNGTLHAVSNVICNGSEKTQLSIHKLSTYSIPALTGAPIDVFTTENGRDVEPGNYFLQVSYESEINKINWKSEKYFIEEEDVLYKRVISYKVPPFEPAPGLVHAVTATLHLQCLTNDLHCTKNFDYVPLPVVPDAQTIAETSDNQGDVKNHDAQMLRMTFDTNRSRNEVIATNENGEILHTFQPISWQNSGIFNIVGPVLKLENQSTSVVSEDSNNIHESTFLVCTSNESGVKQMDDGELVCLGDSAQNINDHMLLYPSSSGYDQQNKLILSEGSCLALIQDGNKLAEITQSVIVNENSLSINKGDLIVNDQLQLQQLPSSSDKTLQNADDRNKFKYISLGGNNVRNSESFDQPAARLHESESVSSTRNVPKARLIPTDKRVCSPWQVEESENSEAYSSHAEKKQRLSQ